MPQSPAILGISMFSRKRRRCLVVVCYFILWVLVLLGFTATSIASRYVLLYAATWALTLIQFAVFYKLTRDTVLPRQEDDRPISMGLSFRLSEKREPDERQMTVRNAAYFQAYRIMAASSLLMPIMLLNKLILGIYIATIIAMFFTLPQAIILWTEPDIPE